MDMYRAGVPVCPHCGRAHTTPIDIIDIYPGAIESLGERLKELGVRKPLVVADRNTDRAAGGLARAALTMAGVDYVYHIIEDCEPVPNEEAAGGVLMALEPSCDFVLGIGSGVINDLCRFVSHRTDRRFGIAATAPSMDGFASTVAPLIYRSLKTTFAAHAPSLIVGDTNILAAAPKNLIAAGYADIVGKLNSLADWSIARLIVGEYYCPWVAAVMRRALDDTLSCADGLSSGAPASAGKLMEALTLSGIAMTYAGNSRPASGFEHHLAHAWEMHFLREGRKLVPHGVKVGIGTIAAMKLARRLAEAEADWEAAAQAATFEGPKWESEMRRVFADAAGGVIELENLTGKNTAGRRNKRLEAARTNWPEARRILSRLPSDKKVRQLLRSVGSPTNPDEIGLSKEAVLDGILYAKEVRDRFTQQQLAWDIGILPRQAKTIAEEMCSGQ